MDLTFGMVSHTDTQVCCLHGYIYNIGYVFVYTYSNVFVYYQINQDPIMEMETLLVTHFHTGR